MSYDLNFWKYKDGVYMDHQNVYEALSNGERVDGLEDLPIDKILKCVDESFTQPRWEKLDDINYESDKGAFQIFTTRQFFRVDCYGMSGNDMNLFIDIGEKFTCPLYDPQVNQRYDGWLIKEPSSVPKQE